MRASRHIPAVAAAALALLAAGCGEGDRGLLSANQADTLQGNLDRVENAMSNDGCQSAERFALEGAENASQQRGVDPDLQANIVDGFNRLAERARAECEAEEPEQTPTPEPTETPTEVPTEVPTDEPTEVPTEVPTDEPTEEPTEVPTEVPTEEPTDDSGTGGFVIPGEDEE